MAKNKRYLIGHRYGQQIDPKSKQDLESFLSAAPGARLVRKTRVGRHVLELSEEQMRDLADRNPKLTIEEDQRLKLYRPPGLPAAVPAEGKFPMPVVVKDATTGAPVRGVTIYGIGSGVTYQAVTNERGEATVQSFERVLDRVIASPRDTYFSKVVSGVSGTPLQPLEIALKPLFLTGAYDWGHRIMGFRQVNRFWTGRGIRVALVDSGINAGDLAPAGGHNTLDGQDPAAWNVDEEGHGTHCAGIVAAHAEARGILGGAPKASVFMVKVFPGGFTSDLVEAVEWCIENQIDVINLSLGSDTPSQVLEMVLGGAYERGITCVAAVGNDRSHVSYPAAFPAVFAVSAIGRFGTFPEDSGHSLEVGNIRDQRGGLFLAKFTNFGPQITVCAPGVAILSTVPTGFAAWDGTSMACAMVSALAALVLEAYPSMRTGRSDQVESMRSALQAASVPLGMGPTLEGSGLPMAPRALATARLGK